MKNWPLPNPRSGFASVGYTEAVTGPVEALEHFRGPHAMTSEHIPDELLAEYSRGSLEGPKLDELEEHLLICEQCRARLTEFDNRWGLNG